ncbi:MAG: carbohydrate ABC transporter permease [Oscillospiraceae bacterium]|jgi:putative aldouronate transport system permease protein|nr:carbohydrate ABC transporter permease [Oscillospiraceae bacterium]
MNGTVPLAGPGPRRIRQRDRIVFNAIGYALVTAFGLVCVLPFLLILINSFTSESALMHNGYQFILKEVSLQAYSLAFKSPQRIFWAYRNTVCVTIIGTSVAVLLASMTGYVLQRRDFPWRNGFSLFFFFTTLFSGGLVPWYIMCSRYLAFRNNYHALLLPMLFSVWNMIIAKNFMKSIPYEITESAKVDGANDLVVFFRLILPLSTPLLATLGLFSALAYWNDWFNSMLFITKENKMSLQYFLQEMINSIQALKNLVSMGAGAASLSGMVSLPQETMKMAMTVITTGPIILLYPLVQRYFVKGLTIGAVKG